MLLEKALEKSECIFQRKRNWAMNGTSEMKKNHINIGAYKSSTHQSSKASDLDNKKTPNPSMTSPTSSMSSTPSMSATSSMPSMSPTPQTSPTSPTSQTSPMPTTSSAKPLATPAFAPNKTPKEPRILFERTDNVVQYRNKVAVKKDISRNTSLTDFGKATMEDRYLMPQEDFQDLFARVASYYGDDASHAQRLYDYISQMWFMPATPILSNGGQIEACQSRVSSMKRMIA